MKRVILTTEERRRMRIELTEKSSQLLVGDGYDTICNHIRLLYKTSLNDFQQKLCEETMFLAKKITKKLKQYKELR